MQSSTFSFLGLLLFGLTPVTANAETPLRLDLFASGFSQPLFVGAPAGDNRLFVVEKGGSIKIVENGIVQPTPFLNLSSQVNTSGEQGLLGLAFDPNYATNGRFYVNYISAATQDTVIARYTASANRNLADSNSGQVILTVDQPSGFDNHKAGWIGFRPNEPSNLYIATGDGGGGNDPNNLAQNTSSNLGKILRVDVSGSAAGYTIPAGNPFAGATSGIDEIWAYGLRNPFRNSFDRLTGDFYIADVGQSTREEVNFEAASGVAGVNYGWRAREGKADNPSVGDATPQGAVDPIYDYDHTSGRRSITGGYVYRGGAIPEFQGTYLFGDFVAGTFGSFRYSNGVLSELTDRTTQIDPTNAFPGSALSSFGEDGAGELYAVNISGSIYKLVPEPGITALLACGALTALTRRRRS
jgi:glucose/arabinose dehydrogenase